MEIKKVLANKVNGQKLIYIPKKSDVKEGDFVKIIKIQEEEKDI